MSPVDNHLTMITIIILVGKRVVEMDQILWHEQRLGWNGFKDSRWATRK